jgi:hypothetical protein
MAAAVRTAQRATSGGIWHGLPSAVASGQPFTSQPPSRPPDAASAAAPGAVPQPGGPAGAAADATLALLEDIMDNVREHVNAPPLSAGPRRR